MRSKPRKEKKGGHADRTCSRCGNQYLLIWLNQGLDYKGFGER